MSMEAGQLHSQAAVGRTDCRFEPGRVLYDDRNRQPDSRLQIFGDGRALNGGRTTEVPLRQAVEGLHDSVF